eukprot:46717-Eustigmatos_ZCMA.PRE.1
MCCENVAACRFQRAWPLQRGMRALRSHSSLSTHVRKCSDGAEAVRSSHGPMSGLIGSVATYR